MGKGKITIRLDDWQRVPVEWGLFFWLSPPGRTALRTIHAWGDVERDRAGMADPATLPPMPLAELLEGWLSVENALRRLGPNENLIRALLRFLFRDACAWVDAGFADPDDPQRWVERRERFDHNQIEEFEYPELDEAMAKSRMDRQEALDWVVACFEAFGISLVRSPWRAFVRQRAEEHRERLLAEEEADARSQGR